MASDEPQGHGECSLRANYQMTYDEVVVRTVTHCGWEEGERFFAVLGDEHHSGSGFQHPVDLLMACSKILIEDPMLRDGCDFAIILRMASESLAKNTYAKDTQAKPGPNTEPTGARN
jgi:hypothetical protein